MQRQRAVNRVNGFLRAELAREPTDFQRSRSASMTRPQAGFSGKVS